MVDEIHGGLPPESDKPESRRVADFAAVTTARVSSLHMCIRVLSAYIGGGGRGGQQQSNSLRLFCREKRRRSVP